MSFTRTQYRTRVLRRIDAESAGRWDTTAGASGEVDQVLGFVFDKEWRRILNANPYYRTNTIQPTSDSNGAYAISDFTTGTGNSTKRFYRIIGVSIDNAAYQEANKKDYLIAPSQNIGFRVFYRDGTNIQALPVQASKTLSGTDGFFVNWIPTRIDNLAADSDAVDFPDGYEEIICLEAAAFLLAKGGAETDTTAQFRVLAESLRQEMLADIQRTSIAPMRMSYDDLAHDWGG